MLRKDTAPSRDRFTLVSRSSGIRLPRRTVKPPETGRFSPYVTGFDMRGVPLSHEGRCTFETALLQFGLSADPPWRRLATSGTRPTSPTKPSTPRSLPA
jgi:hypothetical protein